LKVFLVYAHPEPRSFNGAMKDSAVETLTGAGHEVRVSDLYAMKFKASLDEGDFPAAAVPSFFKAQAEQLKAHESGALAADILAEQEKLFWSDFLVLQFPLWWFSVPAILKGWIDRVFTMGRVYGGGKWYSNGALKGRRAICAVTTGGPETTYGPRGRNGSLEKVLFHVQHGMLYFVGYDVLPPFVAWGASRAGGDGRARYLEEYRARLLSLGTTSPIPFHPLEDFDEGLQLRPEIPGEV
jgi:NAD(P)H dehydrogenase (quinone)